jgi:hypothetical protein
MHTFICIYRNKQIHIYVYVYLYTCKQIYMCVYAYIHTRIYININIYIIRTFCVTAIATSRWFIPSYGHWPVMMMMMMFTLKRLQQEGVTKSNPTQKCRPAKGISKRVSIQTIKDIYVTEQFNNN